VIFRDDRPPGDQLRASLYEGDVFLQAPTGASLAAADEARALLTEALGGDPRLVQQRMGNEEIFERIGKIRKTLFTEPHFHDRVRQLIAAVGVDPAECAFDPVRLRVVLHDGHLNPLARAVYYPHRDTWYSHPQPAIAFWVPLDDLDEHETFVFYPERFRQAVPNDSERFDYDRWVHGNWNLKIGWQDRKDGERAHYPGTLGEPDAGPAVGFSCRRGQNLLFAGAHYHRTLPQSTGRARFSLDFRFVHLPDLDRSLGAPNVDSRCTGSALRDYVRTPPASGVR